MLFVICGQVLFEMVFFMGLAEILRRLKVIPYILGCWLIITGLWSLNSGHGSSDTDGGDSRVAQVISQLKLCLGDRFSSSYDDEKRLVVCKEKCAVTLLGFVVLILCAVDFLMEIDVVLTKMVEIEHPYSSFTSSALATFAIPDLFFLFGGLMQRFTLMKYGIFVVLSFFGVQMLLIDVIDIPAIVSCAVTAGMILATTLVSWFCIEPPAEEESTAEQPGETKLSWPAEQCSNTDESA